MGGGDTPKSVGSVWGGYIYDATICAAPPPLNPETRTPHCRYTDAAWADEVAKSIGPGGLLYLPVSIGMIAFFNYYYTFLQV